MSQQQEVTLQARAFHGNIDTPWQIGSFSALTAGHDAELPDYDATPQQDEVDEPHQHQPSLDRFSFPKGAQAGTCLHSIFELWDFHDEAALDAIIDKQLALYGFEDNWQSVVKTWLLAVVATPFLPGGTALKTITQQQRLDEMGFYFPALLTAETLKRTLLPLLPKDNVLWSVIEQLSFYDLSGFMKGFIDLVFEHEGQYFVVDYKSNFLGSHAEHYQAASLNEAMRQHDYPLQYLIYSLALHRYLKLRLPDYEPTKHLGGVAYLFIRGMNPEWGTAGVFFEHVPLEVLLALDELMSGSYHE
jgi:exodeoxyribonuclease V beta subunit